MEREKHSSTSLFNTHTHTNSHAAPLQSNHFRTTSLLKEVWGDNMMRNRSKTTLHVYQKGDRGGFNVLKSSVCYWFLQYLSFTCFWSSKLYSWSFYIHMLIIRVGLPRAHTALAASPPTISLLLRFKTIHSGVFSSAALINKHCGNMLKKSLKNVCKPFSDLWQRDARFPLA